MEGAGLGEGVADKTVQKLSLAEATFFLALADRVSVSTVSQHMNVPTAISALGEELSLYLDKQLSVVARKLKNKIKRMI